MEKLYYCTANYSYGQNDKIGSETILESKIREVLVTKVIEISLLSTVHSVEITEILSHEFLAKIS